MCGITGIAGCISSRITMVNNYKQTQKDGKCYVCVDIGLELLELHGKVFLRSSG